MNNLKISIITAVYNNEDISEAILSVQHQSYQNIEHIIVDGDSSDGTLSAIKKIIKDGSILISESDDGIYDALNKGFSNSTGDIIGLLHSDDFFANSGVIAEVANAFMNPSVELVYGDLDYVSQRDSSRIIRHWVAGNFSRTRLSFGWMPPHPTIFMRRSLVERLGGYDVSYRISGDFEIILRCFSDHSLSFIYLPHVLVKMRVGGTSNRSLRHIYIKMTEDYRALRRHSIGGIAALSWKSLSKIRQFF
ncbi:glycosyltransferase family 2 protein [Polynucleobacter sp. Latsch14-2]|uniref:glycosyltransferase family 2 protein n=1 Tax=Polynucleobacter sp. Latsch14-2 TaxID=2576920 RepID=UPI001C0D1529|nr:glycosyltransferase family 2 protein [Polynucleobacter sp. Latsch14-2]